MKILYVDEDPRALYAAWTFFRDKAHEFQEAQGGEQGLKLLRKGEVDVVLAEARMTPLNGFAFLQEAGKLCPKACRVLLGATAAGAASESLPYDLALPKPANQFEWERAIEQAVQQMGVPDAPPPARIQERLFFPNETRSLARVRQFMLEKMADVGVSGADRGRIVLAVDEAVTHIIKYAYEQERKDTISLTLDASSRSVEVTIRDSGKPDLTPAVPRSSLPDLLRRGEPKGLGIFLIRSVMDTVECTAPGEGTRSEIRLTKLLA